MGRQRILIVESNAELRAILARAFADGGHQVVAASDRAEAVRRADLEEFDIVISDLTDDAEGELQAISDGKRKRLLTPVKGHSSPSPQSFIVRAFKFSVNLEACACSALTDSDREALREIIEKTLAYRLQFADDTRHVPFIHEKIEFELPSDLSLMNSVLHYLNERVSRLGVIRPDRSNLFVALDEAFVNAVKHGNKYDPGKLIRITAEISPGEARFTVEDEGEGFDINRIPDPLDPANLFKTSGRGVLLIYNIMDEVEYNERGNRLTMVKRPEKSYEAELLKSLAPDDISTTNS